MTRVHTQRSVAVVLTAALLAVLAVIGGGTHAGQRQHRLSAAPVHTSVAGAAAAHHSVAQAPAHDQGHLDLATTGTHDWAPAAQRVADDRADLSVSFAGANVSSYDSRAPPTA